MKHKHLVLLFFGLILFSACRQATKNQESNSTEQQKMRELNFHSNLDAKIENLIKAFDQIPNERKGKLDTIAHYISAKRDKNELAQLTFICTHNSRRSHMSQIWAMTAAYYFDISDHLRSFSGGTEATAFNPRAIAALERAGFEIENPGGDNPHVFLSAGNKFPKIECFSKTYDDVSNPSQNFAAIMTCSDADKNCPIVPGAEMRFSIPYIDPKLSDGTPLEKATYDERSDQIGREMFYLMSKV